MNKKIIMLIIGLLLILVGLLGWNIFNKGNNLDDKVIEDLNNIPAQEKTEQVENAEEQSEPEEVVTREINNKTENKYVKKTNTAAPNAAVDKTIKSKEETRVFEESVQETKTLPDPYVDDNGDIVVQNEFKPHLKDKIFFRGVVYTIKTKLAPTETKKN